MKIRLLELTYQVDTEYFPELSLIRRLQLRAGSRSGGKTGRKTRRYLRSNQFLSKHLTPLK